MRFLTLGLMLAALASQGARAAEFPDWAYPVNPPLPVFDDVKPERAPGSPHTYTRAQIEDDFSPPDWYPTDHPPMPRVVAVGVQPAVKACSKCHLPNGGGHPESTELAGLTAGYIIAQVQDFKNDVRHGNRSTSMIPIAKAVSDADLKAAAEYYASLKPLYGRTKLVEATDVPATELGTGGMRFAVAGGKREPLGTRIIELPVDSRLTEIRDWRPGFIAYVPRGSLARGKALVTTGANGKVIACATCHGPDLNGLADVPRLAGRDPLYLYRQLNDLKAGTRAGPQSILMQPIVATLSTADMVDIAVYLSSRGPK